MIGVRWIAELTGWKWAREFWCRRCAYRGYGKCCFDIPESQKVWSKHFGPQVGDPQIADEK